MIMHPISTERLLFGTVRAAFAAGALFVFSSAVVAQVRVDPDPELFDGTRTKKKDEAREQKTKIDDWEGPNMIVYDSDQQGADGGIGTQDTNIAGNDIDMGGGGNGMPGIPMMGGGGGGGEKESMQIPTAENSSSGGGQENADTAGAAQSATKPSEMAIGDPSKKIATASPNQASADPSGQVGENDSTKKTEDTTEIPSSASGKQSGGRAGGVETGDAMPSNM